MVIEEIPVGKFGFIKRQTLDWLTTHINIVLVGVFGVAALLFGAARFTGWFQGDAQVDFVAAEVAYNKWHGEKEALPKLEKLIRRHPELHAKYDGGIAQKLLQSSEQGLASSYASQALKRVENFSPYYTQFASGTLMISEGKLSDALTRAKELKKNMDSDDAFWEKRSHTVRHGSLLYAYNLLRIAILEKAAGSAEGELFAWRELKKNAGWQGTDPSSKTYDPEAYALIQQNFQKQDTSLLDYINHREEKIMSLEKSR